MNGRAGRHTHDAGDGFTTQHVDRVFHWVKRYGAGWRQSGATLHRLVGTAFRAPLKRDRGSTTSVPGKRYGIARRDHRRRGSERDDFRVNSQPAYLLVAAKK